MIQTFLRIAACALLLAAAPLALAPASTAVTNGPGVASVHRIVAPVPRPAGASGFRASSAGDERDVLLDIPNLSVDEIELDV